MTQPIDVLASETHFIDHLAGIWLALPEVSRGTFALGKARRYASADALVARAARYGIETGELGAADRPIVVSATGDMHRAEKAGRTRIALLEHGTGQSFGGDPHSATHPSYPGGSGRRASLFLSPNAHAAGRDRIAHPKARVEIIGCPKLDAMPARGPRGDQPTVAISFHWDCGVCAETRSGWREFKGLIPHLVTRYRIIGHGHPRIIDELATEYRRRRIEVVRDFAEVVERADLYINEGSSTLFEAAAAGIPVIAFEPSFFRPKVHHGLRFYDAADVGVRVRSRGSFDTSLPKKMLSAIAEALEDAPERRVAREAALDVMYAYRSGAAARAAEVLVDWAGDRAARAA